MKLNPIVLDIETSGLDKVGCGIWQIGAIDLNDVSQQFLEEARIDDEDLVEEGALKITGKTEEQLRDKSKQSQKELFEKFFRWIHNRKIRTLLCQNPQFDITFLEIKSKKYNLKKAFQYRAFDLHSIAQTIYLNKNNEFYFKLNEKNSQMESNMALTNILEFCGIPDKRLIISKEKVVQDGNPHNALEDCKLTGECFSRLVYGKNLFPEFSSFKIPEILSK